MDDFFSWINNQIESKGWNYAELARRTGYSRSAISMTLNGQTKLTWDFCDKLAEAFDLPAEEVFRRAGLLRPSPDPAGLQELVELAKGLEPTERAELTNFARYLFTKK